MKSIPNLSWATLPTGLKYAIDGNINHRTGTVGNSRGVSALDQYDGDVGILLRQPLLRDAWIDQPRATIARKQEEHRNFGVCTGTKDDAGGFNNATGPTTIWSRRWTT